MGEMELCHQAISIDSHKNVFKITVHICRYFQVFPETMPFTVTFRQEKNQIRQILASIFYETTFYTKIPP